MSKTGAQPADPDHFDLLPFIGILMCLLGTLLLVTMSVAAINTGAGATEGWVPQPGRGGEKKPVLIEWDGKYAVWHSERGLRQIPEDFIEYTKLDGAWIRFDPDGHGKRVKGPEPNALDPLVDYLESRRQTHYALFAVRPSGFANFPRFSSRFEVAAVFDAAATRQREATVRALDEAAARQREGASLALDAAVARHRAVNEAALNSSREILAALGAQVAQSTAAVGDLGSVTRQALAAQTTLHAAMAQLGDSGLAGVLAGLDASIRDLKPALAQLSQPFVLQAVPAAAAVRASAQ